MLPPRLILPLLMLSACGGDIYLRDGVTDGDTFYLAERALVDNDPVYQSWVSYSLTLSACKLAIGGENPARDSSFNCELLARRHLLETWSSKDAADDYLDALADMQQQGWLPEYVGHYLERSEWTLPADLDLDGFRRYRRERHPGHRVQTRITGSWNYARNVRLSN